MEQKYQQLIEVLASKFGTTTEHLWGVLIRQAPINGAISLVIGILLTIVTVWLILLIKRKMILVDTCHGTQKAAWGDDEVYLAVCVAFILGVITIFYLSSSLPLIVAAFFNPEYWALNQLIK